MSEKHIWDYKVAPLVCDMAEYIDFQFYDFETTNIRSDILIQLYQWLDCCEQYYQIWCANKYPEVDLEELCIIHNWVWNYRDYNLT